MLNPIPSHNIARQLCVFLFTNRRRLSFTRSTRSYKLSASVVILSTAIRPQAKLQFCSFDGFKALLLRLWLLAHAIVCVCGFFPHSILHLENV